jgi:Nitrogen regulatory protein PII
MKFISVNIPPHKLDIIKQKLMECEIKGITLSEVKDLGSHNTRLSYRGQEMDINLSHQLRLDFAARDDQVAKILASLQTVFDSSEEVSSRVYIFDRCETIYLNAAGSAA